MREAGVNLVSLGIFTWALLEPRRGRVRLRLAGPDPRPAARARRSRSTWPRPTAAPPAVVLRRPTRDARLVDRDGRTCSAAAAGRAFCPSSPDVRRGRRADRRAARPPLRRPPGAWCMWHVHNEYGCAERALLLRDARPRRSATGCASGYGDLDALNAAWGTAFWGQRYGDWEEIEPPRVAPTVGQPGPAAGLRALLLRRAPRQLPARARHPAPAHPGRAGHHQLHDRQLQDDGLLAVGRARWTSSPTTTTCSAERADNHIELAMCRRPDPLGRRRPAVAAHGALDRRGQLAAAQHRQAARRDAPQQPGPRRPRRRRGAVLPVAGLPVRRGEVPLGDAAARAAPDSGSGATWCALGADLGALGRGARQPGRGRRRACVWDWESWWALELEWRPVGRPATSASGWRPTTSALWRDALTVDFVHPDGRPVGGTGWSSCRASTCSREAAAKNLRRYVDGGGHLLVSYFSGIVDENDTVHPGGLSRRAARRARPVGRGVPAAARGRDGRARDHGRHRAGSGPSGSASTGARAVTGLRRRSRRRAAPPSPGTTSARAPPGTCRPAGCDDARPRPAPRSPGAEVARPRPASPRRRDLPDTLEAVRRGGHVFLDQPRRPSPCTARGVTGTGVFDGAEHDGP